jgi:hypothetical protein
VPPPFAEPVARSRTLVSRPGLGTLPCLFTSVDGDSPILASRTAALLGTLAAALGRREINIGVVAFIDSGVFQDLPFRADIAVLLRHVDELIDALEIITLPIAIFFHPDVSCDAAVVEPLQQFAVAVGGIRGQSLG